MTNRRNACASLILLACMAVTAPVFAQEEPLAPVGAPEIWTLAEAVDYAVAHNPDLQTAAAQVAETRQLQGEVFANFLPDLTLEGGYSYLSNVPEMEVNMTVQPLPIADPVTINKKFPMGYHDNRRIQVNLSQVLFASGQVYYANRAIGEQVEAGELRLEAIRLKVAQNAAEAFLGVLMAQSVLEAQTEALNNSRAHLTQVQHRFDAGAASRFELLRAQVEVSNLEPQVTQAERTKANALTALRRIMGLPADAPLRATGDLETRPEPIDEGGALAHAQENRPELAAYAIARNAAEDQARSYRGAMLPAVMLTASYSYQRPFYTLDEWDENWTVGVGVRVPLFDGLQSYHAMQRANAMADTADRAQAQVRADITTDVRLAVTSLHEAEVRLGTTTANMQRAGQMVAIAENAYQAGAVTSLEVIDAQLAATGARVAYLKALYDYRVARVRLAAATGQRAEIGR